MDCSTSNYLNLNESDRKINNAFTAQKQAQDFEMSNVTVVPDGKLIYRILLMINRTFCINFHY